MQLFWLALLFRATEAQAPTFVRQNDDRSMNTKNLTTEASLGLPTTKLSFRSPLPSSSNSSTNRSSNIINITGYYVGAFALTVSFVTSMYYLRKIRQQQRRDFLIGERSSNASYESRKSLLNHSLETNDTAEIAAYSMRYKSFSSNPPTEILQAPPILAFNSKQSKISERGDSLDHIRFSINTGMPPILNFSNTYNIPQPVVMKNEFQKNLPIPQNYFHQFSRGFEGVNQIELSPAKARYPTVGNTSSLPFKDQVCLKNCSTHYFIRNDQFPIHQPCFSRNLTPFNRNSKYSIRNSIHKQNINVVKAAPNNTPLNQKSSNIMISSRKINQDEDWNPIIPGRINNSNQSSRELSKFKLMTDISNDDEDLVALGTLYQKHENIATVKSAGDRSIIDLDEVQTAFST